MHTWDFWETAHDFLFFVREIAHFSSNPNIFHTWISYSPAHRHGSPGSRSRHPLSVPGDNRTFKGLLRPQHRGADPPLDQTGNHVIIGDAASKQQGRNTRSLNSAFDRPDDHGSFSTSSPPSSTLWLAGHDDDLLTPELQRSPEPTMLHNIPGARLPPAAKTSHYCVPRKADDPTTMLKDVPSLPNELPRSSGGLEGVAIWRREAGKEAGPNSQVTSMRKSFSFLTVEPLACCFLSSKAHADPSTPNGLAILALCWSYILSMRVLELQNRKPRYSKACLNSITNATYAPGPHDVVLDLRAPASPQLVRWLYAVLAPGVGWRVTGCFPKWATRVDGNITLVIVSDVQVQLTEHPPNLQQATELVELCDLFGLGTVDSEQNPNFASQAPYTATFLAALAVPIYRIHELKPEIAVVSLKRSKGRMSGADSARIHQYVADLNYYMTLSADTYGPHSTLCSMFWQPDIPCNLVGPWLRGTLDALRPLIGNRNVSALTNVFALRRPRVAMWWLGVLLLGSPAVWDDMVIWLKTTEGRFGGRGLGAISCPDITFSAWTGSSNTFLDQEVTATYQCETDLVPRANILGCRFNRLLQSEEWNTSLCWEPFGCVPKTEVEVDLWPSLEHGFTREYVQWIWWVGKKPDI